MKNLIIECLKFGMIDEAKILIEDKLLEKHFGESFRVYKKKTGMIIPFIG